MKDNTQWIVQFGSTDDPFIGFEQEQQYVATHTESELHKFTNKGQFMSMTCHEVLNVLMKKTK